MEVLEKKIKDKSFELIGIDEVGRGPLAGPVVSCACFFKGTKKDLEKLCKAFEELGITDSKKLNSKKRRLILDHFKINVSRPRWERAQCFSFEDIELSYSLCSIEPKVIDKINILQASLLSMEKSVFPLKVKKEAYIWIDGNKVPVALKGYPNVEAHIKGDSRSYLIAMASIIAKETRDELMNAYSVTYPCYGFEKHSGYPTKGHKKALKENGPCPIHRRTFKGVSELI